MLGLAEAAASSEATDDLETHCQGRALQVHTAPHKTPLFWGHAHHLFRRAARHRVRICLGSRAGLLITWGGRVVSVCE